MKKSVSKAIMALCVTAPMLVGCKTSSNTIFATKISLSETTKSITYDPDATEKESFTLTATIEPSNYNYGTITWSGGKSYDDEYVKLVPSNDGKTCKVIANKVCANGIDVYAKINGEKQELTATCNVKVLKKKVHATSIEFSDTTAKTLNIKDTIDVGYTVTPAENDDLVQAVCSDPTVISVIPSTETKKILIKGKLPGTSTITLSCWDEETKKCESKKTLTVTVSEPQKLNYEVGKTTVNTFSNLKTTANAYNIFGLTPTTAIKISKASPLELMITTKGRTTVDTTNCACTIGLQEKGSDIWIFVSDAGKSDAKYSAETEYTLNANQTYYVVCNNISALNGTEFDVRVTVPAASNVK